MKGDGKKLITDYASRIAALSLLFLICGCGYRIHGRQSLPFQEVRILPVVNSTYEPKLQDRLHRALTEEFLRQGVMVGGGASHTLLCTVRRFELEGLAEREGVLTEYRVVADAECRLTDAAGAAAGSVSVTTPFIVSFSSGGDFGGVIGRKETAEDRAVSDLAAEIVGGLILR